MKRIAITLAALAALVSCTKEAQDIQPQNPKGYEVTIAAQNAAVKTQVNGLKVTWRENDKLAVSLKNGEIKESNIEFKKNAGQNDLFTGSFTNAPAVGDQWFVLHAEGTAAKADGYTFNLSQTLTQEGAGSQKHLNLPVWGYAQQTAAAVPEKIAMQHMAALLEVEVSNTSAEAITLSQIDVEMKGHQIAGEFKASYAENGFTFAGTAKASEKASLMTKGATIAKGGNAKFYIPVMATELTAGETIVFTLTADKGTVTKSFRMKKDQAVDAGCTYPMPVKFEENAIVFKGLKYYNVFVDLNSNGKVEAGEVWLDRNIGASDNKPTAWGKHPEGNGFSSLGKYFYFGNKYEQGIEIMKTQTTQNGFTGHFIKPNDKLSYDYNNGLLLTQNKEDRKEQWKEICPEGYRLPTESEWEALFNHLAGTDLSANKHNAEFTKGSPQVLVASALKLAMNGQNINFGSSHSSKPAGWYAAYWSCTFELWDKANKKHSIPKIVYIDYNGVKPWPGQVSLSWGNAQFCAGAVRCIKDIK